MGISLIFAPVYNLTNMNLKGLLILLVASMLSFTAGAQADEFNGTIQKLQGTLSRVNTGSKTYDQEIKPLQYGAVRYGVEETDAKGAKISYAYEFNLADVDPYAVRQETQKDVILVSMTVRNKQKLVKVYKNNEVQSYDEQVQIRAKDVDNAREIVDLLKKSIPPAEKMMAGKLKLSGYEEMVNWLVNNVKNVELGTKSYKQTISKGDYVGSLKFTQIETDAKGATEGQFSFNLADINLNSVTFKISGNKFAVDFETVQKLKTISATKAGKTVPFVYGIAINTNNVDEARDIKTVLGLVVPLAIEKVKGDNPKANTTDEASAAIKAMVKDVKTSDKVLTQSIESKCITTITQTNQTSNSTEKNVYTFNWMDINPNILQIQASGDKMFVEATALDKKAVIMHFKNDKFDGYENEVKLYTENMEIARRLKFTADKAIEKCKTAYKDPFAPNANDAFKWLKDNIGEVALEEASIKQTFEAATTDSNNKVKYTRISVKGNTSAEEVFEFNFADINPATVEVQVKGKWLYVKFETNFKAKIINAYKDGKIQPYATGVEFAVKDVETARGVIAALKKCIDNFKAK